MGVMQFQGKSVELEFTETKLELMGREESEASEEIDSLELDFLNEVSLQLELQNAKNCSVVADNILSSAKKYNRRLSNAQKRLSHIKYEIASLKCDCAEAIKHMVDEETKK